MTTLAPIAPGTFSAAGTYDVWYSAWGGQLPSGGFTHTRSAVSTTYFDDSSGGLFMKLDDGSNLLVGSIVYATGALQFLGQVTVGYLDPYGPTVSTVLGPRRWNEIGGLGSLGVERKAIPQGLTSVTVVNPPEIPTEPTEPPGVQVRLDSTVTSVAVSSLYIKAFTVGGYTLKGVSFGIGTDKYVQMTDNVLQKNQSPTTGIGTPAGEVFAATGLVSIGTWTPGTNCTINDWRAMVAPPAIGVAAPFTAFKTTFRVASSPLRTGSVSVLGTMQDGTTFNVTADADGKINGTRVKGRVDYQFGLVELFFVNPAGDPAYNVDLSFLQIPGLSTTPQDLVMSGSLRYNAVAFSYLPLDADLLGIDPVRLPSDGRVPIFRAGGFAVVGHTGKITATVANAQVVDCARVRLSRVRVVGNNGTVINTGYTADLEAGTVTFADVSGYSQPVTIEHRIEDMAVVREVQISGEVTFTRALTHDYPLTVPPTSFVSSALVAGDLYAHVAAVFDQATWNGTTWKDALDGSAATGTYNTPLAPIVVTNQGAVTERWALVFTNSTSFNIVGEHVGVIGTGTINADCSPVNPATSTPYFTVSALGWGIGWAVGNILRFNTMGALFPVWVVRTVQQGPESVINDSFTLLVRGDVDRP